MYSITLINKSQLVSLGLNGTQLISMFDESFICLGILHLSICTLMTLFMWHFIMPNIGSCLMKYIFEPIRALQPALSLPLMPKLPALPAQVCAANLDSSHSFNWTEVIVGLRNYTLSNDYIQISSFWTGDSMSVSNQFFTHPWVLKPILR